MDQKNNSLYNQCHEGQAHGLLGRLCREEEGIMRAEKSVVKVSRDYLIENGAIMKKVSFMFGLPMYRVLKLKFRQTVVFLK